MKKLLRLLKGFLAKYNLLPSYGEETFFLIFIALATLVTIDSVFRDQVLYFAQHGPKKIIYLGLFYIIYTTIFSYFRTVKQKKYMFYFILLLNACSIYVTFNHIWGQGGDHLISIVPLLINTFVLFTTIIIWIGGELDSDIIPTRSASYSNVIYGSVMVALIIFIGKYTINLLWPSLFSFAVGYAIMFNSYVSKHLPVINKKKTEAINDIENLLSKASTYFRETGQYTSIAIVTEGKARFVKIPHQYEDDVFPFIEREIKQEDRTSHFVAVVWNGVIEIPRFFRKPKTVIGVATIIYPNNGKKGYQFFQKYGQHGLTSPVYLGRIENIFI